MEQHARHLQGCIEEGIKKHVNANDAAVQMDVRGTARSATPHTQPYLQWLVLLLTWRDLTHARSSAARVVKGQRQSQRVLRVMQHAIEKANNAILD